MDHLANFNQHQGAVRRTWKLAHVLFCRWVTELEVPWYCLQEERQIDQINSLNEAANHGDLIKHGFERLCCMQEAPPTLPPPPKWIWMTFDPWCGKREKYHRQENTDGKFATNEIHWLIHCSLLQVSCSRLDSFPRVGPGGWQVSLPSSSPVLDLSKCII